MSEKKPEKSEKAAQSDKIKVRATADGYVYDTLRKEGSEFEVEESLLSSRWMERVDGKPIVTAKERAAAEGARAPSK
ncbi:MAG TPA: hypothetical protein VFA34_11700 [Actinomycetota bacterium]|jgi:hypothetical protein|nr:hypothetical protein [Actinomycetota bacterium]